MTDKEGVGFGAMSSILYVEEIRSTMLSNPVDTRRCLFWFMLRWLPSSGCGLIEDLRLSTLTNRLASDCLRPTLPLELCDNDSGSRMRVRSPDLSFSSSPEFYTYLF